MGENFTSFMKTLLCGETLHESAMHYFLPNLDINDVPEELHDATCQVIRTLLDSGIISQEIEELNEEAISTNEEATSNVETMETLKNDETNAVEKKKSKRFVQIETSLF